MSDVPLLHPTSPELHTILISTRITTCTGALTPFSHFPASGLVKQWDTEMQHRWLESHSKHPTVVGSHHKGTNWPSIKLGVEPVSFYLQSNRTQCFHKMLIVIFSIFTQSKSPLKIIKKLKACPALLSKYFKYTVFLQPNVILQNRNPWILRPKFESNFSLEKNPLQT